MTTSADLIAALLKRHARRIDLSLDRMWHVLGALGDPHKRLPPTIHVAGTNGKGSTIAFMRAILEASGKRVHVDTSPHLVRYNERIRLGGTLVSDAQLADAFARCEAANGDHAITIWELMTAAAFLLFAEHPADVLLLEVGLGGRFDATNVIDKPVASVITPVSLDHMEFLGETITRIAGEKAGILKRGAPAIFASQSLETTAVLEAEARRIGAGPVLIGDQDFQTYEENGRLIYQDGAGLLDLPLPRLPGRHQHLNAGTAIATLRTIFGDALSTQAISKGLTHVDWPARLQRLTGHTLANAPKGAEVWLDGGHNQDGGRVLSAAMADMEEKSPRPLIMIVGMLATKDSAAFLSCFEGLAQRLYAIGISGQDASRPARDVADYATKAGLKAEVATGLAEALATISQSIWVTPPRILITGSLYLAGEVLTFDGTLPT
ncbi:MAG: bifunctional folylpolyglutamate synthase/dihydrofolate synthase [Beijerinckiaceae bacterium]